MLQFPISSETNSDNLLLDYGGRSQLEAGIIHYARSRYTDRSALAPASKGLKTKVFEF